MLKQRKKIALYGCILGIAFWVIPLFCIVLNADNGAGAIITIDATERDIESIRSTVNRINSNMIKQGVGLAGYDSTTQESIICEVKGSTVNLSINNKVYDKLDMSEKEKFMDIALSNVQNSSISNVNRNKVYKFIANSDTRTSGLVRQLSEDVTVDLPAAYTWFRPLSGPVGVLLGVFTIAIFALLGISTVMDIAFLTIPGVQWALIKKNTDKTKPRFVSLEAWESYQIATETHGQVLGIFFKKKVGQFIVLGICILYLVSGNLFALVAKIVDYLQGLHSVFFGQ